MSQTEPTNPNPKPLRQSENFTNTEGTTWDMRAYHYTLGHARIAVKTPWPRCTHVPPRDNDVVALPHHEVSPLDPNVILVFAVCDLPHVWLVGWQPLQTYLSIATLRKKGDPAPYGVYKQDTYELPISRLREMNQLKSHCDHPPAAK